MSKAIRSTITHSGSSSHHLTRGLWFAIGVSLLAASSCKVSLKADGGTAGTDDLEWGTVGSQGGAGGKATTTTTVTEIIGTEGGAAPVATGGVPAVESGGVQNSTSTTTVVIANTAGSTGVVAAAGSGAKPATTAIVTGGTISVATGGTPSVAGGPNVTSITAADACANQSLPLGLSMYILQDATGSMGTSTASGESKWDAVSAAVSAFTADANSANISAGIGFFSDEICDVTNYTTPTVPMGKLSANAAAINTAIKNESLGNMTATSVALTGALTYARTVATQRATTDHVIVVLATDGLPNVCASDPESATSAAAAAGLSGTPSIPTYVLGVVDASSSSSGLTNMNDFALAGGTGTAFVIDTTGTGTGKSMRALFANAMGAIRDANLQSCTLPLPPATAGNVINPSRASLEYTAGSTTTPIAWRADYTTCDATKGGFYYDNNESPTNVSLCPASCNMVQNGASATLGMHFGCKAGQSSGTGGASGTGGGANRGPVCLLSGQSCSKSAECCSMLCSGSICT